MLQCKTCAVLLQCNGDQKGDTVKIIDVRKMCSFEICDTRPTYRKAFKYLSTNDSFVLQQPKYLNSHSEVVNFTVKRFS